MALSTRHPNYLDHLADWVMMRDFYRGERLVKSKTTAYLPPTSGMVLDGMGTSADPTHPKIGQAAYNAYISRALFPDYVKEAVEAYIGLLHQKSPTIALPKELEPLRLRATLYGESLEMLLRRINEEQLVSGRMGIFLDLPKNPKSPAEEVPYIATYVAETMTNWDADEIGEGVAKLNFVILNESGYRRETDFVWLPHSKYRVLELFQELDGEGNPIGDPLYQFGVFANDGVGAPVFVGTEMQPASWFGATLKKIPFIFVNMKDITPEPDEPPLMGLARLCKAIYCGEADLRQNLFMQGQDTLVLAGDRKKTSTELLGADLRTGAGSTIEMEIGGTANYVGVTANGLAEQRATLMDDRQRAESRSGHLINTKANGVESGDALKTRVAAQTATLIMIALAGASALEQLLKIAAEWVGANPDEVKVDPNLEFSDFDMSGDNVVKLMTAIEMGAPLSIESIHALMSDQGLTRMDFVTEMAKVKTDTAERQRLATIAAAAATPIVPGTPGAQTKPGPTDPANKKAGIVPQK